ncbi:MAG TPA: ThiF family adenylyltransferase, partial [Bacillota bacterium]|nr:ThiF family adenylyltransferase [Bacillota bacterium]
ATVAVLGLGGTSAIIAAFAGMGVGKIIGVDYDTVERSNLNRQFLFSENDLGRLKTEAVYDRLKAINPDIEVENHNLKIEDDQCLSDIIKEADLVINGIDQPAILATRWVNAACVRERKPFIQGGISNTKIMWQQFSPDGGCYDCYIINALQSDSTFKYQIQSVYGQSFDKRNTAFAPNVLLLSGYLGMEVAKLLGKYAPPISKSLTTEVDTITQKRTELGQWHKIENCPTCGTNNKDRMLMDLEELLMFADLGDDSCRH